MNELDSYLNVTMKAIYETEEISVSVSDHNFTNDKLEIAAQKIAAELSIIESQSLLISIERASARLKFLSEALGIAININHIYKMITQVFCQRDQLSNHWDRLRNLCRKFM